MFWRKSSNVCLLIKEIVWTSNELMIEGWQTNAQTHELKENMLLKRWTSDDKTRETRGISNTEKDYREECCHVKHIEICFVNNVDLISKLLCSYTKCLFYLFPCYNKHIFRCEDPPCKYLPIWPLYWL